MLPQTLWHELRAGRPVIRAFISFGWRLSGILLVVCAIAAILPVQASAQERWQVDEIEAAAALPRPSEGTEIAGGRMACAEQRWTLTLEKAPGAELDGADGTATLLVDRNPYSAPSSDEPGKIVLSLPGETIEPLKRGIQVSIGFSPDRQIVSFSLRGSRVAITEVGERCTPRRLPSKDRIVFSPYSSHLGLAREVRADDLSAFRQATASDPDMTAAMLELGAGKRILFSQLCGSSWYYGKTGCSISGHIPDAAAQSGWRVVFESEGAGIYADPSTTTDGWPDIATLPLKTDGDRTIWKWDGRAYANQSIAANAGSE